MKNNPRLKTLERPKDYNIFLELWDREKYPIDEIHSYRDVPGFINDAAWLYEDVVKTLPKNAHCIEVGTYLGQSACRMAELLKEYNRNDVKFQSIDIFYMQWYSIMRQEDYTTEAGFGVPKAHKDYVNELYEEHGAIIIDICRHPLYSLELIDLVEFVCCDSKYVHNLYEDESLDFIWLDANHEYEYIYNEIMTLWPKVKPGGILAGDDYNCEGVKKAVTQALEQFYDITEISTNELSFMLRREF